jgi:DivIVA domain-containing protein
VDRDGIERRDFPTGRRGYDPEAVHEHLRRVADEFETLRAHPQPPPLSTGTSEQVRVILEAAERSAAELRAKAGHEAGSHVARVEEAARGMLGRLGELEGHLEKLLTGLEQLRDQVSGAPPPPSPQDPEPLPDPTANGDEAGARLIALNMALSGSPREETARYLAEHFALADAEALLDDVYARTGR